MSKQDRQGVRTAAGLERKYQFGKTFSDQAKANERQDRTLAQFVSYATTSLETLEKGMTASEKDIAKLMEDVDKTVKKSGDTMTGNLEMSGNKISGVATPSNANDAANKTYVDSNFAPSGFGLGGKASTRTGNWNSATECGWYWAKDNSPNGNWWFGEVIRHGNGDSLVQKAYHPTTAGAYECKRYRDGNGTWQEWEWVTSPLNDGVEYRTTERWKGKAVYTKLIDCGALPNKTEKTVELDGTATQIVRFNGQMSHLLSALPYVRANGNRIDLTVTKFSVVLVSNFDASTYTATVQIWYTKD